MPVDRPQVGETFRYRGYEIVARRLGPDLLGYVDGEELSGFYLNQRAVNKAGVAHVDAKVKAATEGNKK